MHDRPEFNGDLTAIRPLRAIVGKRHSPCFATRAWLRTGRVSISHRLRPVRHRTTRPDLAAVGHSEAGEHRLAQSLARRRRDRPRNGKWMAVPRSVAGGITPDPAERRCDFSTSGD
jgi:hypothetical protein